MAVTRLALRELAARPWGLIGGMLAVAIAVAAMVGLRIALVAHDQRTDALVADIEQRTNQRMAALREEARLFAKHLGFDTLLLPAAQDRDEYLAYDRSSVYLAEAQAMRLVDAKTETLNHVTPVLRGRLALPELNGDEALVIGVAGRIHIKNPARQAPIQEPIPADSAALGSGLARRLGASVGDSIVLGGRTLTVYRVLEATGRAEDIAVLLPLNIAQALLDKPGQVSGVLGLSCECASLAEAEQFISMEVGRIVPDLQVVMFAIRATARTRARTAIAAASREQQAELVGSRAAIREQLAGIAALGLALAVAAAAAVVAAICAANARERRGEIALLRALGLSGLRIQGLLLVRPLLLGIGGALCGCVLGLLLSGVLLQVDAAAIAGPLLPLLALLAGALLALVAAAIPIFFAARCHPATLLAES